MVLRQPCCPSNSCSTGRIFLAFPSPYSRNLMPWSWLVSRMYHACTTHVPRMYHACTTHVPRMYHACTTHVPRMYHACTTHVPHMYLACISQSPPMHLACMSHVPGFGRISVFCFLLSAFAWWWL